MAKTSYNSQNTYEFNINLKKLNIPDFAYHNGKEGKNGTQPVLITYVMGTMKNGFPGGSVIICLPVQEIQVRSLGREDPLVQGSTTH